MGDIEKVHPWLFNVGVLLGIIVWYFLRNAWLLLGVPLIWAYLRVAWVRGRGTA
jgi:hypothetical protein